MSKRRIPIWLLLILVSVAMLVVAIPGLWVFVSLTAKPLHPDPEKMPTVMLSAPSPQWAGAVEQGRRIVRASVAEQNLPGLSVAIGIDGSVEWAEGFGYADLKNSVPVAPNHRFRIGTASTALTSAAAGLLLEEGRLKLDDEIHTYVPAFPKKQQPVTLRQLMGLTPAATTDDGDESSLITKHCERPTEALQHLAGNWRLVDEPGSKYQYSIYDWILVSAAVEATAKQPFLKFMRDRIFDPTGMRDTTAEPMGMEAGEDFPLANMVRELIYDPEATRASTRDSTGGSTKKPTRDSVTYYFPRFASDPKRGMHVMRPVDYSCYAGSSVFESTPSDLVRFGMAINHGKLLQPGTVKLLQTSQRMVSGLGWYGETATLAGKQTRVIGHDGDSLGGMVTSLATFPEHGITVAVTSNIPYADTFTIARKIAETFVGHSGPQAVRR